MVSAPVSSRSDAGSGLRPMNLRGDVPQVLALLNLVFSSSLRRPGRQSYRGVSLTQHSWLMLRLRHLMQGIVPGFVWEESGSIVGNASLLTTGVEGRFLVANVAVHPDYRRRGIGHMLMEAIIDYVDQRGANEILLQVKHDNDPAINLYKVLGFGIVGSVTTWYGSSGKFYSLPVATNEGSPDSFGDTYIRPLRNSEWRQAWMLDRISVEPDLNWPEPLPGDAYRLTLWDRIVNLLSGRRSETWVAERDGEMVGLGSILSEWGRAHTISLRVRPEWKGEIERPLLAKVLRRLRYLPNRRVRIDHPAGDETTNTLLQNAGLRPRRTLTTMRLEL